jgi:hypothetical protein
MGNDLVVQLGAKLDQFASDMNQAGDMADSAISRIENAFASLNPGVGFAGLGGIATGAVAGVTALLAVLQHVNSELADIAKNAEYVGLSVEEFQRKKFAATQGGVEEAQATTDLRNVARLLADAKENENSLTKLLDANNIKYTDRNDDVISLNKLLVIAGDLLNRFHSMPEKVEAAKALGLSEAWVAALKNGSKAFDDVANSADAAGAIIDRSTIAKAEAFDIAWKKSTALLSNQFKAVTADIAGWLDDLIDKGADFIAEMAKAQGAKAGSGQERFNAIADALDVARKDAQGLPQDLDQVNRVLERYRQLIGSDPGIVAGLEEVRAKAAAIADEAERAAKAVSAQSYSGGVPLPAPRPSAADDTTDNDAKLAKRKTDTSRDQFTIAVDDITKRTATIKADTVALFENNAVQAQLRAEFRELTAIMRDHGEVTQAQIDKYEKLRQTMSAQQALTAAGITLTKEHSAAFISSSEGIKTATASYDKARDSLNKINSASSQIGSALSTAFSDAIVEGKSLNDVFTSLLKTLEKAAINSIFTSIFNPGVGGGLSPFASFLGFGSVGKNAEGTDNWRGGPTWVGEKGPEIVNLPRGAQVIPNAVAGRSAAAPSNIINYHIDASGADAGTVARIENVLAAHARAIGSQGLAMISAQREQATGVG